MAAKEKLDLSSLKKAIFQLSDSLNYYQTSPQRDTERFQLHMRAAAIQAFEFTYELCWKMLKRHLEMTEANPAEVDSMSFPELIRTASEKGLLLSEFSVWKNYRKERGTTSHTYDGNKAAEIFEALPSFLKDAQYLFAQLEKHHSHAP